MYEKNLSIQNKDAVLQIVENLPLPRGLDFFFQWLSPGPEPWARAGTCGAAAAAAPAASFSSIMVTFKSKDQRSRTSYDSLIS